VETGRTTGWKKGGKSSSVAKRKGLNQSQLTLPASETGTVRNKAVGRRSLKISSNGTGKLAGTDSSKGERSAWSESKTAENQKLEGEGRGHRDFDNMTVRHECATFGKAEELQKLQKGVR